MFLIPVLLAGVVCVIISFGLEGYNKIAARIIGILIIFITSVVLMQKFIAAQPGVVRASDSGKVIEEPPVSHFGGIPLDNFKHK
jgi:hypothetical protein